MTVQTAEVEFTTTDPHESQAMFEAMFDHKPMTDVETALAVPRRSYRKVQEMWKVTVERLGTGEIQVVTVGADSFQQAALNAAKAPLKLWKVSNE